MIKAKLLSITDQMQHLPENPTLVVLFATVEIFLVE